MSFPAYHELSIDHSLLVDDTQTTAATETVSETALSGQRLAKRKRNEAPSPTQTGPAQTGAYSNGSSQDTDDADSSRAIFGHNETAHFFTTQHGLARFAGSTSGLPLLQVATRSLPGVRADP